MPERSFRMDQYKIGKFIAARRKEMKMTQKELAEQLGITDRAISKWENGRCMPDMSLLQPLSKALGVGVNDLLSGEIVADEHFREKSEQNLVNMAELNHLRSVKTGMYGMLAVFAVLLVYCWATGEGTYGLGSLIFAFMAFFFLHKWHITKDRKLLMCGVINVVSSAVNLIAFLAGTW